jgi:cobalt-zinc-cadmium efflux system membrane fusion protein
MTRVHAGMLAAVCALLVGVAVARAHGPEGHGSPAAPQGQAEGGAITVPIETQFLLGLRTQRVARGAVAESIGVAGRVTPRPDGEARIAAPLAGRLAAPPGGFPRLGDRVRRGQLLARLQQTLGASEAASVAQARQSTAFARNDARQRLQAASARLALAQQNAARLQGLQGVVPAREIAAAQTEVEVAQAALEQARRDLGVGGVPGTRAVDLRAPIEGTIVIANASLGSQVEQGTEIFRVADVSRMYVDVQLSESQAASLGPAEGAVVTSTADPSLRIAARRVAVSALIDPATRTVQALFEVPNPEGRLRIGAQVDVAMQRAAPVEALVVPESALLEQEGVPVVVVKTGAETFEVRGVRPGPRNAALVGIEHGLQPGERVVVEAASSVLLAAQ